MEAFVRSLYGFIESKGRCFQRGTFVVNVSGILDWATQIMATGTPRPVAQTHDVFRDSRKWRKYRACAATGFCMSPNTVRAISPQVEFKLRKFYACGQRKRVALAYLFTVGPKTYMFLKLEGSPAVSWHHVASALRRYVLKRPGATAYATRRENAYVNKNSSTDFVDDVVVNAPDARYYDTQVRTGNEMYINGSLAKCILHNYESKS